jgi:hypothetical protein
MQQVTKIHIAKKFTSDTVCNTVHYLRPIVCRVYVDAEWTLSKRCVYNPYDRIRNFSNICIGNSSTCETPAGFLRPVSRWGRMHTRELDRYRRVFRH